MYIRISLNDGNEIEGEVLKKEVDECGKGEYECVDENGLLFGVEVWEE